MFEKTTIHGTARHDFLTANVHGEEPMHSDLTKALTILASLVDKYPEAFTRHCEAVKRNDTVDAIVGGILADAIRLDGWTQGDVEQCFFTKRVLAATEAALGIPEDDRRYSPAPL